MKGGDICTVGLELAWVPLYTVLYETFQLKAFFVTAPTLLNRKYNEYLCSMQTMPTHVPAREPVAKFLVLLHNVAAHNVNVTGRVCYLT
jgi:hypothetical protein